MRTTLHIVFCAVLLVVASCSRQPVEPINGQTMGTTFSVNVPQMRAVDRAALEQLIETRLSQINQAMSTYQPDSSISQFNRSDSTQWFAVPRSFVKVANAALKVAALSGGAFDPTVGPLVNRWGFGPADDNSIPTDAEIAQLRSIVGYQHLQVRTEPPAVRKSKPQLMLDFSAIAKGYAVDQLAQIVEDHDYHDYLVEIGGELRVSGHNSTKHKWKVGVEHPDAKGATIKSSLQLSGGGVGSSGDYRNYRLEEGVRLSHIIDPRTGRPVAHGVAAVTVVAEDAMSADAWSTALMVLGAEPGMEVADQVALAVQFIGRESGQFVVRRNKRFEAMAGR